MLVLQIIILVIAVAFTIAIFKTKAKTRTSIRIRGPRVRLPGRDDAFPPLPKETDEEKVKRRI
jgi:hypothetical protein